MDKIARTAILVQAQQAFATLLDSFSGSSEDHLVFLTGVSRLAEAEKVKIAKFLARKEAFKSV